MAGKEPSALLPRWEKKLVFRFATGSGQRVDGRLARAWNGYRLKRYTTVAAQVTLRQQWPHSPDASHLPDLNRRPCGAAQPRLYRERSAFARSEERRVGKECPV